MSHERYLEKFIENKKTRVPGKPRHFIDAYLDELEKVGFVSLLFSDIFVCTLFSNFLFFLDKKRGNTESSLSEDQLRAVLLDLHFAGTDTTANTVLSGLLYLMKYPHVQGMFEFVQKVSGNLPGVLGRSFSPWVW